MSEIGKMLTQAWKRLMNRSVRARMNHPILMALLLKDMLLAGSTMRDPSPWFAEAAHRARCSPSSQSEAQEPTILGIRRSCFASYYSFTTSHLCRAALFDSLLNELQCFYCECDHVLLPITTKTCIQLACKRLPMLACNCQCYIATVKFSAGSPDVHFKGMAESLTGSCSSYFPQSVQLYRSEFQLLSAWQQGTSPVTILSCTHSPH